MTQIAELDQYRERRERDGGSRGPQVEDGYTRIANELLEQVMAAPFTLREMRVVMAIIRLTYGWNRKQARATGGLLAKLTGIHASTCAKVMASLIEKKVLLRHGGSRSPVSLNKHAETWELQAGKYTPPTPQSKQPQSGQSDLSQSGQSDLPSKDRKDNPSSLRSEGGASEIDQPELELTPSPPAEPKPEPKAAAKTKARRSPEYTEAFERAWSAYPKRAGSNPKKPAFECWNARIAEGVDPADMLAAVERYAAYVRAKGDEASEFVMQAKRFFGANAEFDNEWIPPAARQPGRQDGRKGFAQPQPQGTYTPTDMDNLPAWMRDPS